VFYESYDVVERILDGTGDGSLYSLSYRPVVFTFNLSETQRERLLAEELYVSLPTEDYPNGEIRGRIVKTPDPQKRPRFRGFTFHPRLSLVDGESASLTVVFWDDDPATSFEWLRNDMPIPGAASSNYVIRAASPGNAGIYRVRATNPSGSDISPTFEVRYFPTAAAHLSKPKIEEGLFSLSVNEVQGKRYVVYASADLKEWTPVATNTAPFSLESLPTSRWKRFYRAKLVE
jgi:hypothetical protein